MGGELRIKYDNDLCLQDDGSGSGRTNVSICGGLDGSWTPQSPQSPQKEQFQNVLGIVKVRNFLDLGSIPLELLSSLFLCGHKTFVDLPFPWRGIPPTIYLCLKKLVLPQSHFSKVPQITSNPSTQQTLL